MQYQTSFKFERYHDDPSKGTLSGRILIQSLISARCLLDSHPLVFFRAWTVETLRCENLVTV
jgi:hypothetical protein